VVAGEWVGEGSSFSEEKEAKRLCPFSGGYPAGEQSQTHSCRFATARLPDTPRKRSKVLWFFLSRKNKPSLLLLTT
jgi:hypothetical protein